MFKPFHLKFAAVLLGAAFTLNSCSQKQEVNPSSQAPVSKADVQVLNGRLVFADQLTFDRLQETLVQKSHLKTSEQELAAWEQGLHFTSLRTTAAKEVAHLEALETAGQPAPSYELLESFGFPDTYAAIINPAGEYQVGAKIYWFHKGFKYEASSEAELAAIKHEPTQAKTKYEASSRIVKEGHPATQGTARTYQTDDPYAYDKYVSPDFNYRNDPGSRRRIIYATRVFSQNVGSSFNSQNVYTQYWKSTVSLLIKYEYYSFGRQKWYPAGGESFNWSAMINKFTGNSYIDYNQNPYPGYAEFASYLQGNFTNGLLSIELGNTTMAVDANQPTTSRNVYWSFEIAGGILCSPQYDSAHYYSVGDINTSPVIW